MHNTRYVVIFTVGMTALVALLLSGMFTVLKPVHDTNEAIYNKKQILGAVGTPLNLNTEALSDAEVQQWFDKVEQVVVNYQGEIIENDEAGNPLKAENINMAKEEKKPLEQRRFPIFIMDSPEGKFYILSLRGNGLWDKIWGWVALESDLNTIAGAAFGHQAETPGLGAEITDNPAFKKQFEGKQIYTGEGEYVSVDVKKGGAPADAPHAVDAISGATVTSVGVSDMLYKGIKLYEPYLNSVKKS